MKKLMLIMAALAICAAASAQQLYELKYYDKDDKETFQGLFFFTSEDECYLTCVSEVDEEGRYSYWSMDYISACDMDEETGQRYIVFAPQKECSSDGAVYPWFLQNFGRNGEYEGPCQVIFKPITSHQFSDSDLLDCDYFREVDIMEKDSDYFLQFFDEDDEWYTRIMEAKESLEEQGRESQDANTSSDYEYTSDVKMHFVLAAATNDKTIGESVETDVNLVRKAFRAMARQMAIEFDEHVVEGSQFCRRNIEQAINNLNVSPNDVVVFIYSGHGFRFDDDTDPYPRMFLTYGNDLDEDLQWSTTDAFDAVAGKNARLTLFLTDCCNSKVGMTRAEMESMAFGTRATNSNIDTKKLCQLFLEQSGTLRATAAKAGQYALCDKSGGFLITSFLSNIKVQVSALSQTTPSWVTIMDNASKAVEKKTSNQIDEAGNTVEPQKVVKALNLNNLDGSEIVLAENSESSDYESSEPSALLDKGKKDDAALDFAFDFLCVGLSVGIVVILAILIFRLLKKKK